MLAGGGAHVGVSAVPLLTCTSPLSIPYRSLQAAKSRDQEGSGSQHFSEVMAGFHAGAAEEFRELEVSVIGLFHRVGLEAGLEKRVAGEGWRRGLEGRVGGEGWRGGLEGREAAYVGLLAAWFQMLLGGTVRRPTLRRVASPTCLAACQSPPLHPPMPSIPTTRR